MARSQIVKASTKKHNRYTTHARAVYRQEKQQTKQATVNPPPTPYTQPPTLHPPLKLALYSTLSLPSPSYPVICPLVSLSILSCLSQPSCEPVVTLTLALPLILTLTLTLSHVLPRSLSLLCITAGRHHHIRVHMPSSCTSKYVPCTLCYRATKRRVP